MHGPVKGGIGKSHAKGQVSVILLLVMDKGINNGELG
jgi:hypothetical protein